MQPIIKRIREVLSDCCYLHPLVDSNVIVTPVGRAGRSVLSKAIVGDDPITFLFSLFFTEGNTYLVLVEDNVFVELFA